MTSNWNRIRTKISSLKDLTTLSFANIIANVISGIFWLLMARLLGTSDYGQISYLIAISSVAGTIAFLGSGNTLIVYRAKKVPIQASIYFTAIISSVLASVILFFITQNAYTSIYVIGYAIFSLALAESLGTKLYNQYSKYYISQRIFLVIFSLSLYFALGPKGVILGYGLSYFPYLIAVYRGFKESKIDMSLVKPRIRFIINSYFLDISRTISGQVDKILVGTILGFVVLGNYYLGLQVVQMLGLLPAVVYQYILPREASGHSHQKLKNLTILSSVIITVLVIVLSPIIIPFLFPKFEKAVQTVQLMSLSLIPSSIIIMHISKFLASERNKIVLIGSGIFIGVQIPSIVLLGRWYNVEGIAIALVLSQTAEAIYLMMVDRLSKFRENEYVKFSDLKDSQKMDSSLVNMKRIGKEITSNSKIITTTQRKLDFLNKNTIIPLLLISCIALLLRLHFSDLRIPLTLDALEYFWYANDLSFSGHFSGGVINIGWPLLLSGFFSIFHFNNFLDYMIMQRSIAILISVLTIIPIYYLCKRFFNKSFAIVGSAIFAFEPRIIQNSVLGITEPIFIFLLTCSFVFLCSPSKNIRYLSFVTTALATIVRIEGTFLLLAISILFFIKYKKENQIILKYIIAIAIFILVLSPMMVIRIQSTGSDGFTDTIHAMIKNTGDVSSLKNHGQLNLLYFISGGLESEIKYLGWLMVPVFLFFVPIGVFLILKRKDIHRLILTIPLAILSIPAFYAYAIGIQETRYLYVLYPLFCVISLYAIMYFDTKIKKQNIFLVSITIGILFSSFLFLDLKNTDWDHEREALKLAYYVDNMTLGTNQYLPESKYLPIPQMELSKFPTTSSSVFIGPKQFPTEGFNSLDNYLEFGKTRGLSHLVVDDSKNRPYFLSDIFYHEEKYPYLIKIFNSEDHGFTYHLKIYKIDYSKFESIIKYNQ